jgi:hypothetical protein
LEGTRAERLENLGQALRLGFDQFTFRLKDNISSRPTQSASTSPCSIAPAPGRPSK